MEESVRQPIVKAKEKARKGSLKFIIAGVIIVGVIAYLGFQSFQSNSMFYLTVPELKAEAAQEGDTFYARQVRVSGPVHMESVDWNPKTLHLQFHIADGGEMFPVEYTGVMPDTFHDSETVVAEGHYTREGVFQATDILVKCPSKYEQDKSG